MTKKEQKYLLYVLFPEGTHSFLTPDLVIGSMMNVRRWGLEQGQVKYDVIKGLLKGLEEEQKKHASLIH